MDQQSYSDALLIGIMARFVLLCSVLSIASSLLRELKKIDDKALLVEVSVF